MPSLKCQSCLKNLSRAGKSVRLSLLLLIPAMLIGSHVAAQTVQECVTLTKKNVSKYTVFDAEGVTLGQHDTQHKALQTMLNSLIAGYKGVYISNQERFEGDIKSSCFEEEAKPPEINESSVLHKGVPLHGMTLVSPGEINLTMPESERYEWYCCKQYNDGSDIASGEKKPHTVSGNNGPEITIDTTGLSNGMHEFWWTQVVDGKKTGYHTFFNVQFPAQQTGSVTLEWDAPTEREPAPLQMGTFELANGDEIEITDNAITNLTTGAAYQPGETVQFSDVSYTLVEGRTVRIPLAVEDIDKYTMHYGCNGALDQSADYTELTAKIEGLPAGATCEFEATATAGELTSARSNRVSKEVL